MPNSPTQGKLILGACLGNCVHVAGILNFLRLAEAKGYSTKFLGPAISIKEILDKVKQTNAPIIALSYRLTPKAATRLVKELKRAAKRRKLLTNRTWLFGGTTPVVEKVRKLELFNYTFDGSTTEEDVLTFLASGCSPERSSTSAQSSQRRIHTKSLLARMEQRSPWPLIRHHFGLPNLDETIHGIKEIARSKCLDIISIAPDQNAQEFFFHPDQMKGSVEGAGGVPIRSEEDLLSLYQAAQQGNYPLLRCYSGTQDLTRWAGVLQKTIRSAWCATPINWYSVLDGRSKRPLALAIRENIENLRWHARNNIPVEVNEPHHWSLRQAHDTIAVAAAYWSAYVAKAVGTRDYIAQLMMNTPLGVTPAMDLAKMWAKLELVTTLESNYFMVHRQVRAGLLSLPVDLDAAKGQIAASAYTAMHLKPSIFHVVGFCEADHAATPSDIITSCKIVRQVIKECLQDLPNYQLDPRIVQRKNQLVNEAKILLKVLMKL
ncbi:MAG: cobalamin B12-binding domain-containing protein, partial [Promethearchaeota archaeon]